MVTEILDVVGDRSSPCDYNMYSVILRLSLSHSQLGGGVSWPRSTAERTTCVEDQLSWCSLLRYLPTRLTDSKEEDAVPSRRRLRSVDTLETVVVRYGGGSWSEADCGPSSTGQQWCTGFWSSQISSVPEGWFLRWRCFWCFTAFSWCVVVCPISNVRESGYLLQVVAWPSADTLVSINEVTLRRARLVLGWVTVCEQVNHLNM